MEKTNNVKRSDLWNDIYEVLARLDLKESTDDCLDRPSAATEIEKRMIKNLGVPRHVISRTFNMSINVTQKENGEIDVRDSAGIRIYLINKTEHKGLWMYFNTRLDQYVR